MKGRHWRRPCRRCWRSSSPLPTDDTLVERQHLNSVLTEQSLTLAGLTSLPDLAPGGIDEAPLSNLHFMKGLAHYHSARYSHALAEFMLAGEDEHLAHVARFWLASAYLSQRQYAHAYLELIRLTGSESIWVREVDLAVRIDACEQH